MAIVKCLSCLHILVKSMLLPRIKGKTAPQELFVSFLWQNPPLSSLESNVLWTVASELQMHALRSSLGIDPKTAEICPCNLSAVVTGSLCLCLPSNAVSLRHAPPSQTILCLFPHSCTCFFDNRD